MHNSTSPATAGRVLLHALVELAEEHEEVRDALLQVSGWLQANLADGQRRGAQDGELGDKTVVHLRGERRLAPDERSERPLREHREVDLRLVLRRSGWKARAARFAIERRRYEGSEREPEFAQTERELRSERESIEDCFAWMLDPYRRLPDDERLTQIADSYGNVALASEITLRLEGEGALEPGPPSALLYLLAESQSALLAALSEVDLRGDSDQRDLFLWLKDQTTRHRIYVDRHMRLDDPADFRNPAEFAERLRRTADDLSARREARRKRGQLLNKLRYHLRKVSEQSDFARDDYDSVVQAVDAWLEADLPAGDRVLRDLLESLVSGLPNGVEPSAGIATVMASQPATFGSEGTEPVRRPDLIERATGLLNGRNVLVFAGEADEAACEELRRSLALGEVRWVPLAEDSDELGGVLEREIERDDLALVLIAVRLSVPAYTTFKELCIEGGKPFVRLPSGTGPAQVAHQVLRQVGRRLRATEEPAH